MPRQLFVFIQLEFPWALGPADGRYLVRRYADAEPERVVVLGTLAAGRGGSAAPKRRSKRALSVAPEPDPEPVATTRVTAIDPVSLSAENQAKAWLAELDCDREVDAAIAVVNRMLYSQRIATADPYIHEVSAEQALVIRAGWGEGEQVADGLWAHARELPWSGRARGSRGSRRGLRRDRTSALRPQERLAALLGARGAALLCEELALRARQDLDQGRVALAALELDCAFALAPAELRAEKREDLAIRVAELEQLRAGVQEQADATLPQDGGITPDEEVVTHALERLEAALRARTAAGL
jgi:hypothetical protein